MSRSRIFGVDKFRKLLVACTFAAVVEFLMGFVGSIVSGLMLGETALSGVSLVFPIAELMQFLCSMLGGGMAINYAFELGRCDRRRAHEFFTQGLWTVVIVGGLFLLAMIFGRELFIGYMGAEAEVAAHTRAYWNAFLPIVILQPLSVLLLNACYVDGDSRLCYLAYAVQVVVSVGVSVLLLRLGVGTAGCAFGPGAGFVAATLVLSCHFLTRGNSFRLVRHFSLRDSLVICRSSFGDACGNLGDAIVHFFLGKAVILNLGSSILPVMSVVLAVFGIVDIAGSIGTACQPFVSVYYGEGNFKAVRAMMRRVIGIALVEGFVLAAVFMIWPGVAIALVGVDDPSVVGHAETAVRIVSLGIVLHVLADTMNNYYQCVGREELSIGFSLWKWVAMPLLAIAFFARAGVDAMWTWYPASVAVAVVGFYAYLYLMDGHERFFLQLPHRQDRRVSVFELSLEDREIVSVAEMIDLKLEHEGIEPKRRLKARLIVEEVLMAVKELNAPKSVMAEVTLDLNDGIMLTLRDDGAICDITDSDRRVSSLRGFIVASVMESHRERMNLVTIGCNRNVFRL